MLYLCVVVMGWSLCYFISLINVLLIGSFSSVVRLMLCCKVCMHLCPFAVKANYG